MEEIKVLELFSGIGGMHRATQLANKYLPLIKLKVVGAVDINTVSNSVYRHNHPETSCLQRNITGLSLAQLEEMAPEMVVMSPPCQPHTRQGKQLDRQDPRSSALDHLMSILPSLTSLKFLLLENVFGFEKSEARDLTVEALTGQGFSVQEFLLCPRQIGVPNSRLRYYLLAKRGQHWSFQTQEDIITDVSSLRNSMERMEMVTTPRAVREFIIHPPNEDLELPEKVLSKHAQVLDIIREDSRVSCCFTSGYQRYCEGTGSVIQAQGSKDDLDRVYQEFQRSGDVGALAELKLRYFSPSEISKLLGFPPEFSFPNSVTVKQQYKVLGNSLNITKYSPVLKPAETEMAVNPERISAAQSKLSEDPHDTDSWVLLIKHAQCRSIDEARETYERLVEIFPTCGRYWKLYIEQEIRAGKFENVEKLFGRCLIRVLSIDLWKTYLLYVKETKASLPTYKEKMAQAYDFALDRMGLDIQSHGIWSDYIKFLRGVEAAGSFAENQKITAIRKVYQRAVINPMMNIEILWKEYTSFEQSINPMIAEKLTQERSRDYMNARRVAKEYEAVTRGLNKSAPSVPPTGSQEETKQVELWHNYINWEKSNPLQVEDPALVTRRVMFAYEQALLCLSHHADIWYEAASYLQESSKTLQEKGDVDNSKKWLEEASQLYDRAVQGVLTKCSLLYFTYADFEEANMNFEKVHKIYQDLLSVPTVDPTLCYIQYMKFCRRAEGVKSARTVFKKAREDERSNFHVFVAAALMEYYSSKDNKVAFKIFDLGLRKFGNSCEYIMAYLDYLSHLNEDNNTRVLFERVLAQGTLDTTDSLEIWNKFLEFESNIGDLASVVKVEKRRSAVMEEAGLSQGKPTVQVIDRYRFMSLLPLSSEELKSIGYQSAGVSGAGRGGLLPTTRQTNSANPVSNGHSQSSPIDPDYVPRPDFSQMVPFKPKVSWRPGILQGGEFPPPPAAQDLLKILPPPSCFQGPHVIVDKIIEKFNQIRLSENLHITGGGEPHSTKLFDLARSVQWIVDGDQGRKRKSVGRGDDDSDDDSNLSAPSNDIYRSRQKKKIK